MPESIFERRCYDGRGQLMLMHTTLGALADCGATAGPTTRLLEGYVYDGRGNRIEEHHQGFDANLGPSGMLTLEEVTHYGYDLADRLTGVRYPDGSAQLYRLGVTGRRESEEHYLSYPDPSIAGTRALLLGENADGALWGGQLDQAKQYKHDDGDLLTRVDTWPSAGGGAGGTGIDSVTVTRDQQGRVSDLTLTSSSGEWQRRQLAWDVAGRLQSGHSTRGSGVPGTSLFADSSVSYSYDADGLRIGASKQLSSSGAGTPLQSELRRWTFAGRELVAEASLSRTTPSSGAGTPTTSLVAQTTYTKAGALILGLNDKIALHDGMGSVVGELGASGLVQSIRRFGAFGEYRESTAPTGQFQSASSLGYTGHQWDEEQQLVYAKARWYAPELGSFLSIDPALGDPGRPMSFAPFSYAMGNPLRYTDPTGMAVPLTGLSYRQRKMLARNIGNRTELIAGAGKGSTPATMRILLALPEDELVELAIKAYEPDAQYTSNVSAQDLVEGDLLIVSVDERYRQENAQMHMATNAEPQNLFRYEGAENEGVLGAIASRHERGEEVRRLGETVQVVGETALCSFGPCDKSDLAMAAVGPALTAVKFLGKIGKLKGVVKKLLGLFKKEGKAARLEARAASAGARGAAKAGPKSVADQAAELVPKNGGKNRVTLRSPSQKMEVDLTGKAHGRVPTPHTKVSPRNPRAPKQPAYNTKNAPVREATQQDIRTVRRALERRDR